MDEIEQKILLHLRQHYLPQNSQQVVGRDDNVFEAGIVDSVALLSVITFLEREFSIEIPDEDLLPEHFSTIANTAAYVRSRSPLALRGPS